MISRHLAMLLLFLLLFAATLIVATASDVAGPGAVRVVALHGVSAREEPRVAHVAAARDLSLRRRKREVGQWRGR